MKPTGADVSLLAHVIGLLESPSILSAIPHEQENENVEENEEPNEPPASDHVDDSDDVEDGGDHVHDDESHGNEVEQALNDEPVTIELRRSSRVFLAKEVVQELPCNEIGLPLETNAQRRLVIVGHGFRGSNNSEWSIKEVLQTAFSTKPRKNECVDSTVRQ
ncbi:hypothetical protein MRB53_006458 [Persea americana]|uniref:Uncharacterized protein n=1 Tax=Persea americana TaxID=3435 RepID=A0ACC2MG92_PERAE|nr:hypothetical protein MRB53_006458 [Persea americana]